MQSMHHAKALYWGVLTVWLWHYCCLFFTVCKARVDLAFVVDGSGSVGRANFIRSLNFIKNLVSSFVISPRNSRVGILVYSHRVIPIFSFGQYKGLHSVLRAIDRIKYPGGGTKTGRALSYSRRYLFARSNLRKVLVLVTDGKSYDRVARPAAVLRNMGVEVFALGVGRRISMKQLIQIASNRRHIFTANFRNLGSFVRAIKQKACKGNNNCSNWMRYDLWQCSRCRRIIYCVVLTTHVSFFRGFVQKQMPRCFV